MPHGVSSLAIVSKHQDKLTSGIIKSCEEAEGERRHGRTAASSGWVKGALSEGQRRPLRDAAGDWEEEADVTIWGKALQAERSTDAKDTMHEDLGGLKEQIKSKGGSMVWYESRLST